MNFANSPKLTTEIDPNWDPAMYIEEDSGDIPLTGLNTNVFEQVLYNVRITLRDELLKLELQAVEACMDDIGWVLPNDERANDVLEYLMVHRLVQPVEVSGTGIRVMLVLPCRSNYLTAVEKGRYDEDIDMLDTAEW
jgi:hypothetical protein